MPGSLPNCVISSVPPNEKGAYAPKKQTEGVGYALRLNCKTALLFSTIPKRNAPAQKIINYAGVAQLQEGDLMAICQHLGVVTPELFRRKPNTPAGWEECLKMADVWVHLPLSLESRPLTSCHSSKHNHAPH